jgi:hypothetical protein
MARAEMHPIPARPLVVRLSRRHPDGCEVRPHRWDPDHPPFGLGARRRLSRADHPTATDHDAIAADRNGQVPLLGQLDGLRWKSRLQLVRNRKPASWTAHRQQAWNDHQQTQGRWDLFVHNRGQRPQDRNAAAHATNFEPASADHSSVVPLPLSACKELRRLCLMPSWRQGSWVVCRRSAAASDQSGRSHIEQIDQPSGSNHLCSQGLGPLAQRTIR